MRCLLRKTLASIFSLQPRTAFNPRTMSSESTQRQFQLKFNPLTGNSEWVVIEEHDSPEDSPKPLLATTSYLDMLNDNLRNRAFCEAINKTVTKSCHVLDIGAGTGLLSMIATRAMESSDSTLCSSSKAMVTACESYLPMVKLMRKVLRLNGMDRKVRVINKRSDEVEVGVDITSRADVLVSEILDSELLGEGLIPTLQHAHDNLLVENPESVPYRATTYGQLVECTYLWKLHDLGNNEANASDDIRLVPSGMERILCVKPQQFSMHCDAMKEEIKLLSEPFKIFEFDFWKRPDSHGDVELHIRATNDGTVHAVISWWILQLDREGSILYSTAPKWTSCLSKKNELQPLVYDGDWCDHWKQCVWFIPEKGLPVRKDEEVHIHAIHTDTNISYDIKTRARQTEVGHSDPCKQQFQLTLSPERIAIYGDNNWRHSILKVIENALQQNKSPLCVVADDSIFLTIAIAHLSNTSHIISFFPGLREKGAQYVQDVAVANGFLVDRVEVLKKRKMQLTMHDTQERKVDLLVGEPFYYGSDNILPWHNLRFWSQRTMLDSVLSEDVLIVPCKGLLKACAVSLPDLWRSRCSLKEIVGFDHSVVNTTLGACGGLPASQESPCLPFFIWQCGEFKKLSEICTVMEFDFLKPISPCAGETQVKFTEPGICHGFALWIDWVMDMENSTIISGGLDQRYWKQGVKLLNKPIHVGVDGSGIGECCSTIIDASFNPSSGELVVRHDFL